MCDIWDILTLKNFVSLIFSTNWESCAFFAKSGSLISIKIFDNYFIFRLYYIFRFSYYI